MSGTLRVFNSESVSKFVAATGPVLYGLKGDPRGQEKYEGFLKAVRGKCDEIGVRLKKLAGSGQLDEFSFFPNYSKAAKDLKFLEAGGWQRFSAEYSNDWMLAADTEATLRAMEYSLLGLP